MLSALTYLEAIPTLIYICVTRIRKIVFDNIYLLCNV